MRCVTVIAVAASLVLGQATALLAENGPPSKDRYIIVLKPPKSGVPELSDHDITATGGKIEYKVPGRIQVTLPAPAVEALRKQERVKYIQKVILGPLPDASAAAKLLLTPSTASLRATGESTPPTWRSGTYKYDASGNIYAIGLAGDTGSPLQHRYAYDEVSRLKRADTMTTPTHTETFTYDVYGNLTEHVDGSSTTYTPVEDANTNRLKWSAAHPYTYDAAGNLTADYNATYAYDPIGMLREKDYTNEPAEYYIYTASDERIGVKYGTSSGSPTIWSIRDFSGNVLRQYEGHDQSPQMAWLWVEDYVYRDGQLLAAERVPEEGGRRHFHLDHLGSPRLVTGQDTKEMSEHDYAPLGLESNYQETAGGFDREDPRRFTGHERDYAAPGDQPSSTAYLDYMHARYYSPVQGRFLSPDPVLGDPYNPQSWNRYTYARNNPLRYTDPDGRCTVDGETHGSIWCFAHTLGFVQTQHEHAQGIRKELTSQGIAIVQNGRPLDARKMSDAQVVAAYQNLLEHDRANVRPNASAIPLTVLNTLNSIDKTRSAPEGHKGGRQFSNDGRGDGQTLPKTDGSGKSITYREWDVNASQPGVNRGAERIVTGSDGSAWYSNDHYQTFTRIR